MNDNQSLPQWARAIRAGAWNDAERDLASQAAGHLQRAQESEVMRLTQASGPYAKYTAHTALQKAVQLVNSHNITDPQAQIDTYDRCLQEEIASFRRDVRPGYQRDMYNSGNVADAEVRDYVKDRNQQVADLKAEGKRVAAVTPRSGV